MAGSPGDNIILAPEKVFNTNKLVIWWQNAIGQKYGQNGEKGTDFDMPFNTPVGAISGGTVVYAGLPPDSMKNLGGGVPNSLGYVVQVKNSDGSIIHYQHLKSLGPGIASGRFIAAGDVIGNSGGLPIDQWSTGPHIEVRYSPTWNSSSIWSQNWQDPLPYFSKLGASFKPGTVGQNTIGTPQGPTGTPSAPYTSQNCAPWDIGCLMSGVTAGLRSIGVRIALFIVGAILLIIGFLILTRPDISPGDIAKTAVMA